MKGTGKHQVISSSSETDTDDAPVRARVVASITQARAPVASKPRKKTQQQLMTELLERHNLDAGESIVVDVLSETEDIDELASAIATSPENIHPRKLVYMLPRDHYRKDLEDVAPMIRIFRDKQVGIKHPNEIQSSISLEDSVWYVEAFKVRVPHG